MEDLIARLAREAASVTPEQIAAASASLGPINKGEEKLLSVLDRPDIHRLWALAHEYDKRGALHTFEARYVAQTEAEKNAAIPRIAEMNAMEELCRNMTWIAIRMVDPTLYNVDTLGLRAGFQVVKAESPKAQAKARLRELLEKVMTGGVHVIEHDVTEEDDEEDEEKIQ